MEQMTKGFVVLAQNTDTIDYVRQAYALALSIKLTQSTVSNISIITNDVVPKEYKSVFDNIIEIPWGDSSVDSRFKVENRWKIYHASPYIQTIVLDTDMLVLDDLSNYWETFENYEVYYTSKVVDYRNKSNTSDYYRKAFTANNLPNLYSGLHYFKKSEFAKEFYTWVELISNNWELFYGKYVSEHYPDRASMDITAALAARIMDAEYKITNYKHDPVTFTHMKSRIQGWTTPSDSWLQSVAVYFDEACALKIANFQQQGVFHYTEKEFLTDKIISKLENKCLAMN
jgi:hypothetical protein